MYKTIMRLVAVFAAILVSVSAFAQITTSSMNGKIADASGAAVPGATVIAVHTPSGTQYYAVTNNEGRYNINGMRSGGPYTVEISCLGYQAVTYTDVALQLAEPLALNATLSDDTLTLTEAIVISTASSKFNSIEKTGAVTNISNSQMTSVPSVSRSVTDIAKMSPYGGNGMNFSGSSGRSANFTVDGANFNNNFGLSSSLPGGGNPISIDAIEEMQVVISPFDVRQSNFIGGGINAITKSGTNTVKGSAYVYHRNENMHGNRIANKELSERAKDRLTTYGFTLGGPVIKNKLFYFTNFETSVIPTVSNRWRPSIDGVADTDKYISRVTEADAKALSDFLKREYDYDPGSYNSYPSDEKNIKFLARLDWNINSKNRLAVRYNYTTNIAYNMPSTSRDVTNLTYGPVSQYGIAFANSMYAMNNNISTISLDLNSNISSNLSNQFLVTFSDTEDVRSSNSKEFPFVDILAGDLGESDMPYMTFGYELFTWKNRVGNKVLTAKDDIVWYAGAHKVTAGISFEHQTALNVYMRNGTGMYRYASLSDFMSGAAPVELALDWGYNGEVEPSATVTFNQLGLYAQDEWNPYDNLKLTAGIRFDTILFDNDEIMTNNAIKELVYRGKNIDTGMWPSTKVQVSPRIGFTWDVLGDKTLKVRGGTGLFAGRLPLVFFTNMPTNSGMVKGRATSVKDPAVLEQFAGKMITDKDEILKKLNSINPTKYPLSITPDQGTVPSEVNAVDPDFRMPQVWKTSVAVDYVVPVGFPLTVTGEVIYNKTLNGVMLSNWNMPESNAGWSQFTGADNRHIYPSSYKYNKAEAYVLTNTNKGYGLMSNITVKAEPVPGLNLTAGYTHTVTKELTGMPGSNAKAAFLYIPSVDGPNYMNLHNASTNNPDRLMASVSYTDKAKNSFSLFYEGTRYGGRSFMYSNDMNGDGQPYDLIYIPKDESEIRFVSDADADRYWSFAAQDKYLSSHKGKYAEAYGIIAPWRHTFDFRYSHDFTVKVGQTRNTLQLSFDLMNAGNLFNSSWGVSKTFHPSHNGYILKYDHTDGDGTPVFTCPVPKGTPTWDFSHTYANSWYMQIGIRYMFN